MLLVLNSYLTLYIEKYGVVQNNARRTIIRVMQCGWNNIIILYISTSSCTCIMSFVLILIITRRCMLVKIDAYVFLLYMITRYIIMAFATPSTSSATFFYVYLQFSIKMLNNLRIHYIAKYGTILLRKDWILLKSKIMKMWKIDR